MLWGRKLRIASDIIIKLFYKKERMKVINTTAQSKEKIQSVLEEGGGVAVLDFISKKNPISIELMPIAEQLNAEHHVPLIKIDADMCPELSKIFLVDMTPTFVVVK
jgi:thioredoxin-like negative regulator of GroEL